MAINEADQKLNQGDPSPTQQHQIRIAGEQHQKISDPPGPQPIMQNYRTALQILPHLQTKRVVQNSSHNGNPSKIPQRLPVQKSKKHI
jgi:hypothetical protein